MKSYIEIDGKKICDVEIPLTMLSISQRLKKSAFFFFGFLLAVGIVAFIPVLHLALVPGFILAAIVFGWINYRTVATAKLENFSCPQCQSKIDPIKMMFKENESSTRVYCYECRQQIYFYFPELEVKEEK